MRVFRLIFRDVPKQVKKPCYTGVFLVWPAAKTTGVINDLGSFHIEEVAL